MEGDLVHLIYFLFERQQRVILNSLTMEMIKIRNGVSLVSVPCIVSFIR